MPQGGKSRGGTTLAYSTRSAKPPYACQVRKSFAKTLTAMMADFQASLLSGCASRRTHQNSSCGSGLSFSSKTVREAREVVGDFGRGCATPNHLNSRQIKAQTKEWTGHWEPRPSTSSSSRSARLRSYLTLHQHVGL